MFDDARLTALYDSINLHAEDTDFYLELAAELAPRDVTDLGCGTGRLTLLLAELGHRVTGVDPSAEMLADAAAKENPHGVQWVEGGAESLGEGEADLVLMTGHVAQFFIEDADWRDALHHIGRALRPGGWLAFETRNPLTRPWERWTQAASRRTIAHPEGPIDVWYDTRKVRKNRVEYVVSYQFPGGERVDDPNILIFRDRREIESSLAEAGFVLDRLYGDWDRSAVTGHCPELIYVAQVPPARDD